MSKEASMRDIRPQAASSSPANASFVSQKKLEDLHLKREKARKKVRECNNLITTMRQQLTNGAEVEMGRLEPILQEISRTPLTKASLTAALGEDGYKQVIEKIPLAVTTRLLIGPAASEVDE
jgi:hypothetical protein